MTSNKSISVVLGKKQQAILQQQIDSGRYDKASDVISDALTLMNARDTVFDQWLREDVRASLADTRPAAPIDDTFRRIRARIARPAKAAKRVAT